MYLRPISEEQKKAIATHRDEQAFKTFYLLNFNPLRNYALSFLKDKHLSEDVASELMWKIWHLGEDILHISCLESYMLRAIKNKCLNILRVRPLVLSDPQELEDFEQRQDDECPEQLLIQSESIARILRAVEGLPAKTKMAFHYVKQEKRSYKEVAETMNISVKTVDRHIQIALKKLWDTLKNKK